MSFTNISVPAVGDATKRNGFANAVILALGDLNDRLALLEGQGLVNGSFESDVNADGDPDGWQIDESGGGVVSLETTAANTQHGAKAVKVVCSLSNQNAVLQSGASADVSEYVPCAPGQRVEVAGYVKASASGVEADAWLRWYKADGTQTGSDVSVYTSADLPTSWAVIRGQAVAPADARYYRVKLRAGGASSAAGTVWLDGFGSRVYHGPVWFSPAVTALSGTGTVYVTVTPSSGEVPRQAYVLVSLTDSDPAGASVVVKGWVAGAWAVVPAPAGVPVHVPLDPTGRFRVDTTSIGGEDTASVTVYAAEV